MKTRNYYVLIFVCLFSMLVLFPSASEGVEGMVEIVVEKHVLLPGEYLVNILRNTYKIPDHLIFNEYLDFIKELNPDIKNISALENYQTILIPLSLPPKHKKYKIAITQPERVSVTMTSMPSQETLPPPSPKSEGKVTLEKVDINRLLKDVFTPLFDESGVNLQQDEMHVFPEFEGSELSLDTAIYPILQFKNNTTIIIDPDHRLPPEIKEVIQSNWSNYKIVPSRIDQGLEVILDNLIKEMGFFKVVKQGEPLVRGQDVLFKIAGDWMVFPDSTLHKVFVINLVHSPEHKTPIPLREYLDELDIKLIDIDLFGQDEGALAEEDEGKGTDQPEIARIDFTDKLAFIDTLLELAGQDCSKNVPISIYSRDSNGLALNVTIDRTFIKKGKKHLIYLQDKSPKLLRLLTQQGFPLLKLTPEEDAVTTISKVLDFLDLRYQSPIITFAAGMATNKKTKIWINIPGIFFETEEKNVFLTHLELHQTLTSFLKEKGIQPTIYQ